MFLSHSRSLFCKYFMSHKWNSCSLTAPLIAQILFVMRLVPCGAIGLPPLCLSPVLETRWESSQNRRDVLLLLQAQFYTLLFISVTKQQQNNDLGRSTVREDRIHHGPWILLCPWCVWFTMQMSLRDWCGAQRQRHLLSRGTISESQIY